MRSFSPCIERGLEGDADQLLIWHGQGDEKKRPKKEATASIYINLSKEAIEVQRLDVEAKRLDA
jgi:hypothetical protein